MTDKNNDAASTAEESAEDLCKAVFGDKVSLAAPRPSLIGGLGKWALAGALVGGAVVGGVALYNKFFGDDSSSEPEA